MSAALDPRVTPARRDLAAVRLRGLVEAEQFVDGVRMQVAAAHAPVRREPRFDAPLDTEALRGEIVIAYERSPEGWAWVECERDGYVGYVPTEALRETIIAPTHRVRVLRSHLYPGPSIKLPPIEALPLGALVTVAREQGDFRVLDDGAFIWARHLQPLSVLASDFVAEAEKLIGVAYLWGGRTSEGLDCSGLVQTAMEMAGLEAPRDSDMQERELGQPLNLAPDLSGLRRGDLIFWKGHVGLMRDEAELLHANGYHMQTMSEPLAEAVRRINGAGGGDITSARRLGELGRG
ncbi:C40 family peptidase [Terrarubrum flagellatum]|uniref:C40 family peptidase n=1 Tax=Terrirubrum flagellatum TaxID=2895980 RepID=UPI00314545FA